MVAEGLIKPVTVLQRGYIVVKEVQAVILIARFLGRLCIIVRVSFLEPSLDETVVSQR